MISQLEQKDIEAIAEAVIEKLKPILSDLQDETQDQLFTVDEVAGYLRVKKVWIYQKIHSGGIPYYKAGKYPRFRKSVIDKWLETNGNGNGKSPKSG